MPPSQVLGKKRPRDSKQKHNGFIVGDFSSKEERENSAVSRREESKMPTEGKELRK